MKIVLIGAGNVATHLAVTLNEKGIEICQIFSRTEENARALAEKINAEYTTHISQLKRDADVYLYSVSDSVLPDLAKKINAPNALHIHTSGSIEMDIFADFAENYGVLYPLQTFSKHKMVSFAEIPIFIEGNNEFAKNKIYELARILTERLHFMDSAGRKNLHLSAVFVCNFVNHLYEIGAELVQDAGVNFDVLQALIKETTEKIETLAPYKAQTGPAVRNDQNIIKKHLKLLKNKRHLAKIYELISEDIYSVHKHKK
jgi:predicted short-subunit dehydrogenase-like oxidoreductase (DUF2520 family)